MSILVIEDGSVVTGANSYIDVAYLKKYASDRNITFSVNNQILEKYLILAMDWLESKREFWKGSSTSLNQELNWPRSFVVVDGIYIDSNSIPIVLKNAQAQLVVEIANGIDLMPTTNEKFVTKEVVGSLEVEYSEKLGGAVEPVLTKVDAWLAPLLKATTFRVTRA